MKLLDGKVLEYHAYLSRILRKDVVTQNIMEVAADRAFKVRVFHQGDGCLRVAKRGGVFHLNLFPAFDERIFRHVRHFTTEKKLPVFAHVELDRLLIFPDGEVDGCFKQTFDGGFLGRPYHQQNVRPKSVQMTKVGFDILLRWRLSSGYRRHSRRLWLLCACSRRKGMEEKNQRKSLSFFHDGLIILRDE